MRPVYAILAPAALAIAACLAACIGGSDGVENPKMVVEFPPPSAGGASAGNLTLYGSHRDPVGDPVPLLTRDFSGRGPVTLTPEEFDSALRLDFFRHGRDPAALGDTVVEFNLVAVSGAAEIFVEGFRYRRQGRTAAFARVPPGGSATGYGTLKAAYPLRGAVLGFSGKVGRSGELLGLDYVFIPGSPYHGTVGADQTFQLPRLSEGIYGVAGADRDSSKYYLSTDSLSTDDTMYTAKAWDVITFIDP